MYAGDYSCLRNLCWGGIKKSQVIRGADDINDSGEIYMDDDPVDVKGVAVVMDMIRPVYESKIAQSADLSPSAEASAPTPEEKVTVKARADAQVAPKEVADEVETGSEDDGVKVSLSTKHVSETAANTEPPKAEEVQLSHTSVQFGPEPGKEAHGIHFQIVDKDTGEVIRSFPAEKMFEMTMAAHKTPSVSGLFLDTDG